MPILIIAFNRPNLLIKLIKSLENLKPSKLYFACDGPRKNNKNDQEKCENRKLTSISEELYKRLILPFYTLIISLIAASLIIEPKSKYFNKAHKINIFFIGSLVIILSQISLKFFLLSVGMVYTILILPLILVIFYYFLLLMFTKFRLNYL